jgi:hypothetical protein
MNNYDFIKKIDQKLYYALITKGLIPMHIMDWVLIYENYLEEKKKNKATISVTYVAEKYNCSEIKVWKIINFMKS